MKKSPEHPVVYTRLIAALALMTLLLAALDVLVHHHTLECFLPDMGRYVLVAMLGGVALIGLALALGPVISRKEDYYDK